MTEKSIQDSSVDARDFMGTGGNYFPCSNVSTSGCSWSPFAVVKLCLMKYDVITQGSPLSHKWLSQMFFSTW